MQTRKIGQVTVSAIGLGGMVARQRQAGEEGGDAAFLADVGETQQRGVDFRLDSAKGRDRIDDDGGRPAYLRVRGGRAGAVLQGQARERAMRAMTTNAGRDGSSLRVCSCSRSEPST